MEIMNIREKIEFLDKSFTKRIIYQDNNVVSFVLNFKPGQALPAHTHFDSTVVVFVYSGAGELTADDTTVEIHSGNVISLKGQEMLSVKNTGTEDMTLYVNMAPKPDDQRYVAELG